MRFIVAVLAVASLACAACEPIASAQWVKTLTAELLRRVSEDQTLRKQEMVSLQEGLPVKTSLLARIDAVDCANTEWRKSSTVQSIVSSRSGALRRAMSDNEVDGVADDAGAL